MSSEGLIERLRAALKPVDAPASGATTSDFDLNPAIARPQRQLTGAAVLAALVVDADRADLILTQRAAHLSRHAGQIAFPGGRIDPTDASPAAAALREAHEEIGLPPDRVELIGASDPYETGTGFLISPFVGVVRGPFSPVPDPGEVDEVFHAPFDFFMDPANHQREEVVWRGARRRFYAMTYGSRRVWGATAGMLRAIARRLADPGPAGAAEQDEARRWSA